MRGADALALLASRPANELSEGLYVTAILEGVAANKSKIDELIMTYAQGWDMDRMPAIDRNILRIALFEILFSAEIDDQIAASEAVDIAGELSTDDSAKYINGVLGRVIVPKPSLGI